MLPIILSVALALTGSAASVLASPTSNVAAARSALDRAVAAYDAALARADAIQAAAGRQADQLDETVALQAELEAALGQRALYLYRSGPIAFVEVLLSSSDLADFIARWDALVRLSREDAKTIGELRATRTRMSTIVAQLLGQQAEASRRLRALASAKVDAARTLGGAKSDYAEYLKRIAAREAAAAVAREGAATGMAATAPRSSGTVPARTPTSTRGTSSSAPWRTAVASCYGTGSYGIHLSSGFTIGPDSMIVAHKTLPFGTLVEFSYHGRTGIATVADRGPYVAGRTWDLGPGIARVLGFEGVGTVRYRIIGR